jgi:hypothetical protein
LINFDEVHSRAVVAATQANAALESELSVESKASRSLRRRKIEECPIDPLSCPLASET